MFRVLLPVLAGTQLKKRSFFISRWVRPYCWLNEGYDISFWRRGACFRESSAIPLLGLRDEDSWAVPALGHKILATLRCLHDVGQKGRRRGRHKPCCQAEEKYCPTLEPDQPPSSMKRPLTLIANFIESDSIHYEPQQGSYAILLHCQQRNSECIKIAGSFFFNPVIV